MECDGLRVSLIVFRSAEARKGHGPDQEDERIAASPHPAATARTLDSGLLAWWDP